MCALRVPRAIIVMLVWVGVLAAPALAGDPQSPDQEMCPVMPDEPIESTLWTLHEGKKVWFCCRKCQRQFAADPSAYSKSLLRHPGADAAPSGQGIHAPHPPATGWRRSVAFIGRFHVVVVHFPIALLILAAALELAALRKPWRAAESAVPLLLAAGTVTAVLAAALGLANGIGAHYDGRLASYFTWHRALGLAVAGWSVVALIFVARRRRDSNPKRIALARVALVLLGVLVVLTGHFGGALVFGPDYFVP